MQWGKMAAAAVAVAFIAAAPASALVIDTFDTPQLVTDPPAGGNPTASELAAPEVIGGYRDMFVDTNGNGTTLEVIGGQLGFSNNFRTTGSASLTYDGMDNDPFLVNTTGLNGFNLVTGADPFFLFDVDFFDVGGLTVNIQVWDMFGNSGTYSETLTAALNPRLFFSEFSGDVDFTQVGAIQFMVSSDQPNLDGALNAITVSAIPQAVPVPAAAFLLVGAVGGLGALRLRRKS